MGGVPKRLLMDSVGITVKPESEEMGSGGSSPAPMVSPYARPV